MIKRTLFLIFLFTATVAHAEILSTTGKILGPSLAGVTVKDLIEDARQEASRLIADGRSSGDALMTRAGDELNMLADNLLRSASSQLGKPIEKLDNTLKQAFIGLHNAKLAAESFGKRAYELKDTAVLDIRSVLGSIPLVKDRLIVQRVGGLTQLFNQHDYSIELMASYVGLPSDTHSSEVFIEVEDKTLKNVRLDPKSLHHLYLHIPNEQIAAYFKDEKINFVDAKLHIKQRFKKGWWLFKRWEEKNNIIPLTLVLYPQYAGVLKVTSREKIYGWKNTGTKSNSATGGNNHCSKRCKGHQGSPYEVSVSVSGGVRTPQIIGDQKITKVSGCGCVSGTCAYDRHNHSLIDLKNTRARCGWQGRSHPSTWRVTADLMQWDVVDEKDVETSVKVFWDKNFEVKIPNEASLVKIQGTLLSGDSIDLIDGQAEPKNLITRVSIVDNQADDSLIYRVNRPKDI